MVVVGERHLAIILRTTRVSLTTLVIDTLRQHKTLLDFFLICTNTFLSVLQFELSFCHFSIEGVPPNSTVGKTLKSSAASSTLWVHLAMDNNSKIEFNCRSI